MTLVLGVRAVVTPLWKTLPLVQVMWPWGPLLEVEHEGAMLAISAGELGTSG